MHSGDLAGFHTISTEWGYSVVEFTPDGCTYIAYSVDKTVNSADVEKRLMKVIRVPEGRIEIQEETDLLS